jgi:hypothetical protein
LEGKGGMLLKMGSEDFGCWRECWEAYYKLVGSRKTNMWIRRDLAVLRHDRTLQDTGRGDE